MKGIEAVPIGRDQVDIACSSDVRKVLSEVRPDIVVNAAAYTKVDLGEIAAG